MLILVDSLKCDAKGETDFFISRIFFNFLKHRTDYEREIFPRRQSQYLFITNPPPFYSLCAVDAKYLVYNDLPPGRSIEKDMFEGGFQIEEEIGRAYFHRQKHSSEVRSFFAQIDIDSSQIWPTKDRQFNSEGSAWDAANEMRAIVLVLLQNYLLSEENLNLCFGTNATFVKFYKLSSLCRNRMVVSTAQSTC